MAKRAVIQTGGKQYLVTEGETITIEKLEGNPEKGASVTFDDVLLTDDGTATTLGAPQVAGGSVKATVTEAGRAKKVIVVKYKAKSRYHKKRGHRQPYMKVKIDSVK